MIQSSPRSSGDHRVLCIEDDRDTCEFLAILLSEFRFEFAHSVTTALTAIERSDHDLYILDNWLPDGSGIDLCRRIRQKNGAAPILFTSGSSDDTEIAAAIEAGADRYLLKPCEPDKLREIVKELILRN
jgi:two-component system, OmpR family, response regulator TctD